HFDLPSSNIDFKLSFVSPQTAFIRMKPVSEIMMAKAFILFITLVAVPNARLVSSSMFQPSIRFCAGPGTPVPKAAYFRFGVCHVCTAHEFMRPHFWKMGYQFLV